MLAAGHSHAGRVLKLLEAAKRTLGSTGPIFGASPVGMELIVRSPNEPPADATNFLGGVGDVLEAKGRRGVLDHLGELAQTSLYANDRQIHEVRYRWEKAPEVGYVVRLWRLSEDS